MSVLQVEESGQETVVLNLKLGNISLRWMLQKAVAVGLPIDETKIPTDADIDVDAPLKIPRDPIKQGLRDILSGDRVHDTVTPRSGGRCNNRPASCVIETQREEMTRVRA